MPRPVIPQEGTLAYATFHIAARLCDVKKTNWHWIPYIIIQHFGGIINRIGALGSIALTSHCLIPLLLQSERDQLWNLGRIVLGHSGTAHDIAAVINARDIRDAAEEDEQRQPNPLPGPQPQPVPILEAPSIAAPDAITFLGSPPTTMRVDCDRIGDENRWEDVTKALKTYKQGPHAITHLVLSATETKPHISVLGLLCENSVHKPPQTELPDHLANHLESLDLIGFCTITTKAQGRAHLSPEIKRLFHHLPNLHTIRLFTSEGGSSVDIDRDMDYTPTLDSPSEQIRDFITDQATAIPVTTSSRNSLEEAYETLQLPPGGGPAAEPRYLELVVDNTLRDADTDGDELQFVRNFSTDHQDRKPVSCIVVRVTGRPTCDDLAHYLHLVFTLFPTQYLDIIGIPNDADYTGLIDKVKPHLTDDMAAIGRNLSLETKNKSFQSGDSCITNLVVEYQQTWVPPSNQLPCIQKLIQALTSHVDLSTPDLANKVRQEDGNPKADFAEFMRGLKRHHPNLQIINISDMHKFRLSHFTAMADALVFSRRPVTLLCHNWKEVFHNHRKEVPPTNGGGKAKFEVSGSIRTQFIKALKSLIAKGYNGIYLDSTNAAYSGDVRSLLPMGDKAYTDSKGIPIGLKSPRKRLGTWKPKVGGDAWKLTIGEQLKQCLKDLGNSYILRVPLIRTGEERSNVLSEKTRGKQVLFAVVSKKPPPVNPVAGASNVTVEVKSVRSKGK